MFATAPYPHEGDGPGFGRYLQALVSLLCVLSLFSSTAHMFLVEHVKCAEHGEWVHATDHHDAGGAELHSLRANNTETGPVLHASTETEHEHDDCLFCSERSRWVELVSVLDTPPETKGNVQTLTGERAVLCHGLAVYAFAPKTSPPGLMLL